MKNKVIVTVLVMFTMVMAAYSKNIAQNPPVMKINLEKNFYYLEVNDHISVVLTNETGGEIVIDGDRVLARKVRAVVKKNRLYIWLAGNSRGETVTVYVPALLLKQVVINGDSRINTATTLNNSALDIVVNGACRLNLRSRGKIAISGTNEFEFTEENK
ncbi:MAG TPA: DUF2807 domain-containing protein [Chitinophagaceae bacterium]|nr:DUF2807 domain-containing protein [Chitinophagaceae bacterium]